MTGRERKGKRAKEEVGREGGEEIKGEKQGNSEGTIV